MRETCWSHEVSVEESICLARKNPKPVPIYYSWCYY